MLNTLFINDAKDQSSIHSNHHMAKIVKITAELSFSIQEQEQEFDVDKSKTYFIPRSGKCDAWHETNSPKWLVFRIMSCLFESHPHRQIWFHFHLFLDDCNTETNPNEVKSNQKKKTINHIRIIHFPFKPSKKKNRNNNATNKNYRLDVKIMQQHDITGDTQANKTLVSTWISVHHWNLHTQRSIWGCLYDHNLFKSSTFCTFTINDQLTHCIWEQQIIFSDLNIMSHK